MLELGHFLGLHKGEYMKKIIIGIGSFLFLDLYFNVTTHLLSNSAMQLVGMLLFFPIASYIAKLNGLSGLKGIGLFFHKNGFKFFIISFGVGFLLWAMMYTIYWWNGKFEITGMKVGMEAVMTVISIIVGFFLGSMINDLITRGFIINLLKRKIPVLFLGAICVLVYAMDDFWNGDITLLNFIFSISLGCSLTYAFMKTGSVWANTGIHFGLNVAYGMIYGLSGEYNSGLFLSKGGEINQLLNQTILLSITILLFLIVFTYYRKNRESDAK